MGFSIGGGDYYTNVLLYGYRFGEYTAPVATTVKAGIRVYIAENLKPRKPVSVALPIYFRDAVRPKADPADTYTTLYAALKRVGRRNNARLRAKMLRFSRFVKRWIRCHITPIDFTTEALLEVYLQNTSYTLLEKENIRKAVAEHDPCDLSDDYRTAKCFVKEETYDTFKASRWIMSRCLAFKGEFGPFIHLAEHELYKNRWFVKHLTPEQRARVLAGLEAPGRLFYGTDHTAFEAAVDVQTATICELELLRFMYRNNPDFSRIDEIIKKVVGRDNILVATGVVLRGVQARMSGDNHTSFGNGFTNLMSLLFANSELGLAEVSGLVEGDDAIYTNSSCVNNSRRLAQEMVENGFTVKMDLSYSAQEAKFCQLECDSISGELITDPTKVLLSFGWASRQYVRASKATLRALMRAKAMSYAFMYPSCPLIAAFMTRVINLTEDVRFYKMIKIVSRSLEGTWYRDKMLNAIHSFILRPTTISPSTRCLVMDKYGIAPSTQVRVEQEFLSMAEEPRRVPVCMAHLIPPDCITVANVYVVDYVHSAKSDPIMDLRRPRDLNVAFDMLRNTRVTRHGFIVNTNRG